MDKLEKPKRVYVSTRFAKKEEVKEIYSKLEKLGYTRSGDWTEHKAIKPYSKNQELAKIYSARYAEGIRKADLVIIISDNAGTNIHSELGVAIDYALDYERPLIYVIGEYLDTNLFFFHPAVKRRKTIEDVVEELKKLE